MNWRRYLIDIPVLLVDLWFLAYRVILTVATIVSVTAVVILLVLAALGIRWGW